MLALCISYVSANITVLQMCCSGHVTYKPIGVRNPKCCGTQGYNPDTEVIFSKKNKLSLCQLLRLRIGVKGSDRYVVILRRNTGGGNDACSL